jgi:hypothetical protein
MGEDIKKFNLLLKAFIQNPKIKQPIFPFIDGCGVNVLISCIEETIRKCLDEVRLLDADFYNVILIYSFSKLFKKSVSYLSGKILVDFYKKYFHKLCNKLSKEVAFDLNKEILSHLTLFYRTAPAYDQIKLRYYLNTDKNSTGEELFRFGRTADETFQEKYLEIYLFLSNSKFDEVRSKLFDLYYFTSKPKPIDESFKQLQLIWRVYKMNRGENTSQIILLELFYLVGLYSFWERCYIQNRKYKTEDQIFLGFTSSEEVNFFFSPIERSYYISNYREIFKLHFEHRFSDVFITVVYDFLKRIKDTEKNVGILVNFKEANDIMKTMEINKDPYADFRQPFKIPVNHGRQVDEYRPGQYINDLCIIYHEDGYVYVSDDSSKWNLFRLSISEMSQLYDHVIIWKRIVRDTQGVLDMYKIAIYASMYLPVFVEGGFIALAQEVFINEAAAPAIGKAADAVVPGSGQFVEMGVTILSPRANTTSTPDKILEREIKSQSPAIQEEIKKILEASRGTTKTLNSDSTKGTEKDPAGTTFYSGLPVENIMFFISKFLKRKGSLPPEFNKILKEVESLESILNKSGHLLEAEKEKVLQDIKNVIEDYANKKIKYDAAKRDLDEISSALGTGAKSGKPKPFLSSNQRLTGKGYQNIQETFFQKVARRATEWGKNYFDGLINFKKIRLEVFESKPGYTIYITENGQLIGTHESLKRFAERYVDGNGILVYKGWNSHHLVEEIHLENLGIRSYYPERGKLPCVLLPPKAHIKRIGSILRALDSDGKLILEFNEQFISRVKYYSGQYSEAYQAMGKYTGLGTEKQLAKELNTFVKIILGII